MTKEDILQQADHPFFMVAFGITPFVLGFGALLLWAAKNSSSDTNSPTHGLARLIQKR